MHRIYLAHPCSDDAECTDARDNLATLLSQREDIEILPRQSADSITDAEIHEAISASEFSLHFLGIGPGRCDSEGRGIVQRQFEIAEAVERERMLLEGRPKVPRLAYLKSSELRGIEEEDLEPEEWDSIFEKSIYPRGPGKHLRAHLHFVGGVLKPSPPARVFYSYAREDHEHLRNLRKCLIQGRRRGKIIEWYDGFIDPAQPWREELLTAVKQCDVLIYLVTQDSLASPFAHKREFRLARELGKKVILVSVSSANLDSTGIEELQLIPRDNKSNQLLPVVKWGSISDAWTEVSKNIQKEIESWSAEKRRENVSVPIEPFSDLGNLKDLLESRFGLRRKAPNRNPSLGRMVFLDWVSRPASDSHLDQIKTVLARRSRLSCAPVELAKPRDNSHIVNMYGLSDVVFLYCADRSADTTNRVQKWMWELESKRRYDDRPKYITVFHSETGSGGDRARRVKPRGSAGGIKGPASLSREQFTDALPTADHVLLVDLDGSDPESAVDQVWRRMEE